MRVVVDFEDEMVRESMVSCCRVKERGGDGDGDDL